MDPTQKLTLMDEVQEVASPQSLSSEWTMVSSPEDPDSPFEAMTEMERLRTARKMLGNHLQIVLNAKNEATKIHKKREEWNKVQLEDAESRIAQLLNQNTHLRTAVQNAQNQKANIEYHTINFLEIAEANLKMRAEKEKQIRHELEAIQLRNTKLSLDNTIMSENLARAEEKIEKLVKEIKIKSDLYQKGEAINESLLKEKGSWEQRLEDMTQGYSDTLEELMDAEDKISQLETNNEELSNLYEDAKTLNTTLLDEQTESNTKLEEMTRNLTQNIDKLHHNKSKDNEQAGETGEVKNLSEDTMALNIELLREELSRDQRSVEMTQFAQTPPVSIINAVDIEMMETEHAKLKQQLRAVEQEKKDAIEVRQHAEHERQSAVMYAMLLAVFICMVSAGFITDLIKIRSLKKAGWCH